MQRVCRGRENHSSHSLLSQINPLSPATNPRRSGFRIFEFSGGTLRNLRKPKVRSPILHEISNIRKLPSWRHFAKMRWGPELGIVKSIIACNHEVINQSLQSPHRATCPLLVGLFVKSGESEIVDGGLKS